MDDFIVPPMQQREQVAIVGILLRLLDGYRDPNKKYPGKYE